MNLKALLVTAIVAAGLPAGAHPMDTGKTTVTMTCAQAAKQIPVRVATVPDDDHFSAAWDECGGNAFGRMTVRSGRVWLEIGCRNLAVSGIRTAGNIATEEGAELPWDPVSCDYPAKVTVRHRTLPSALPDVPIDQAGDASPGKTKVTVGCQFWEDGRVYGTSTIVPDDREFTTTWVNCYGKSGGRIFIEDGHAHVVLSCRLESNGVGISTMIVPIPNSIPLEEGATLNWTAPRCDMGNPGVAVLHGYPPPAEVVRQG